MPALSMASVPFILDAALQNALETALPGAPIAFQGLDFDPSVSCRSDDKLWVRPVCRSGDVLEGEKGHDGWSRRMGLYIVDIFSPAPLDPADAWRAAALVEAAFRRRCFEGVQAEDPKTENFGFDGSGSLQLRVSVPWWCWAG